MVPILLFVLCLGINANQELVIPDHKLTFNPNFYEQVINEQLCYEQIQYLKTNNTRLLLRFLDAGIRTPRGLLDGNLADLGNYYQCLAIDHWAPSTSSTIKGKYCTIHLPLSQDIELSIFPDFPLEELKQDTLTLSKDVKDKLIQYEGIKRNHRILKGHGIVDRVESDSPLSGPALLLAVCIPKTCTTDQAIAELFFNTTEVGLQYEDAYCRLPNDKQWVAADYVAISIFSVLLLMVIASTGYDVYQTSILGNDPKHVNKIYQSFSIVTNTRQLVTYTPVPGSIECLDGMRALSMIWIVLGHVYLNQLFNTLANLFDFADWLTAPQWIWITMYAMAVDTFFMMSGLLVVYTSARKLTRSGLIKSLHMFYLNRLLRMFPVLAAIILLQVSILNRIADGPNWTVMAENAETCRVYWWSALLHVQNWVNPYNMCLKHTWYLSVDIQLHIISPLVLFWLLGNKKQTAWIALAAALILSLIGSSVYNFILELQSLELGTARISSREEYFTKYYINTLTRSSAFLVGMIYGYIFHLYRQKRLQLSVVQVGILWACSIIVLGAIAGIHYPIMQPNWDNQTVDNLVNSYMRPLWALAVGWIALACHHGYGGPVNWLLSLRLFKVLSLLSYAMYIVHYPLIFMVNSTTLVPTYFAPTGLLFKFLADFSLTVIVAYLLTLLVDSPCATLVKRFLGDKKKPDLPPPKELSVE